MMTKPLRLDYIESKVLENGIPLMILQLMCQRDSSCGGSR
jgi:hypothetical protein